MNIFITQALVYIMDELLLDLENMNLSDFKMGDLDEVLTEIDDELSIMDLAIEKVVVWIDRNPHHSYPKWIKSWKATLRGNRHLNHVRLYATDKNSYYAFQRVIIDADQLFDQLVVRGYFMLDRSRVRLNCSNSLRILGNSNRIKRRRISI